MATSALVGTPGATKQVPAVSLTPPGGINIAVARARVEEELEKMRGVLDNMKEATLRQKNISADVKNGIARMEDSLDLIESMKGLWKIVPHRHASKAEQCVVQAPPVSIATQVPSPGSNEAPRNKRVASNKVERKEDKRMREDNPPSEWSTVESRKTKQKKKQEQHQRKPSSTKAPEDGSKSRKAAKKKMMKRGKPRAEALLIKSTQGRSYADVLGELRKKVKPEDSETEIRSIRQTKAGGVLLELGDKAKNKEAFCEVIRGILGDSAVVSTLEPRCSLEIRDLDCLTAKEEVEEALKRDIPDLGEVKVGLTSENPRKQRMAIVDLGEKAAVKLLKQARIKIGWVYCRVRERVKVTRCYKCLGYGHLSNICQGPDRSNMCYKCGKLGHKAQTCSAPKCCVLCREAGADPAGLDHIPGTGVCGVFRAALQKVKRGIQ